MNILAKNYSHLISGFALTAALMAGNFVNLVFNAYLGRVVTPEEFGILALINTFLYVGGMFYNALGAAALFEVSRLEGLLNSPAAAAFLSTLSSQVLKVNVIVAAIWAILVPWTAAFFHIDSPLILYLFTPVLIFYPLVFVGRSYLQGKLFFALTGFLILLEPVIKLISAYFLIELNLHSQIYNAIYISAFLSAIITILIAFYYKSTSTNLKSTPYPHKFFWAAFLTGVSSISFLALDMVLVKHFLPPNEAGNYAFLALLGKIIYFLGSLLNIFTISIVSREASHNKNPKVSFYLLFAGSFTLCSAGVITLGVFGQFFIPLIFGNRADAIIPYALPYVSSIALFTLGSIIVTYHLARKNYLFPFLSLGLSSLLTVGILLFNRNLTEIVYVLFIVGVIYISGLLMAHFYKEHLNPRNITVNSIERKPEESLI